MDSSRQRIVLLTDGHSDPLTAKTAVSVLRYRKEDVVAVFDRESAGKTSDQLLGFGGDTPVVGSFDGLAEANTLMIGIAPPGGQLPDAWRSLIHDAIDRGMDLVSGMHQFLRDDREIAAAAAKHGVQIHDVRKNDEADVAACAPLREECLRVLTIGQDCSIGKMVTSVEIARALGQAGVDAKFIATGQTGIMVEGDGCPIDCVVSDFVNGAVEKLVTANQHREMLVIEGQATIAHPRYSCVSAGLLHGSRPHGMILVYEPGRTHMHGLEHVPIKPLPELIRAYESLAGIVQPSEVFAVAMNSRRLTGDEADRERERARGELGLPVADPIRHGTEELVAATLAFRDKTATARGAAF